MRPSHRPPHARRSRWPLTFASVLFAVAAAVVAQMPVDTRVSGPPPAPTVRYGQTALLPSESRNVMASSGLLPSERRDVYRGSGATLPSQGIPTGTVRYGSYNQAVSRTVNNTASSSVRYGYTAPAPPSPRPVPTVRVASSPAPNNYYNNRISTYRPAQRIGGPVSRTGTIRYGG